MKTMEHNVEQMSALAFWFKLWCTIQNMQHVLCK